MTLDQTIQTEKKNQKKRTTLIDCDVHVQPVSPDEIKKYLAQPFRDGFSRFKGRGIFDNPLGRTTINDKTPSGGPVGSDPDHLRKELIEPNGTEKAILNPWIYGDFFPDPDLKAAINAAYNTWLDDTWLSSKHNHDGVFKGSITVSHQDPAQAVREIERWAGHPHFVQVYVDSGARAAFGSRQFWPIYEACERHGLPLAIHVGSDGIGGNAPMSTGFPNHFIEWATLISVNFQAHLTSMLCEGVFERFPGFRVVLLEGGQFWLPGLMWRLDGHYKSFRFEVPWVKKLPSLYLRDHVRFGTQPMHRTDNDEHFLYLLEAMDAENIMMFSSDYPHYDTDVASEIFPRNIPEQMKQKIYYDNAKAFYNF
jgi:predicted TIM-barrel fold metal-dependent hydrolase